MAMALRVSTSTCAESVVTSGDPNNRISSILGTFATEISRCVTTTECWLLRDATRSGDALRTECSRCAYVTKSWHRCAVIDPKRAVSRRARIHTNVVLISASATLILYFMGGALGWWTPLEDVESLVILGSSLIFTALGALILGKADSHPVGWLFALVGLSILLSGVSGELADRGLAVFGALGGALWFTWFGAVGLLVLWYPTGKVPGSRWIWAQRLGLVLIALTFSLNLFAEELCVETSGSQDCAVFVANPIGIPGVPNPEFSWILGPFTGSLLAFLLASLTSLVVRLRRARAVERLQLKWFLLACSLFAVSLVGSIVYESWSAMPSPFWLSILVSLSILFMPVSATVAILRYRLFEIDRIISRTVSYGLVVGVLAAAVAGVAALAGSQFQQPWVVAATTLGVAALFNPLRKRVQGVVDRRFNRSRYDAQRVMDDFAGSLRDRVDADEVVEGWLGVVDSTMQPTAVGVWVRE